MKSATAIPVVFKIFFSVAHFVATMDIVFWNKEVGVVTIAVRKPLDGLFILLDVVKAYTTYMCVVSFINFLSGEKVK